MVKVLCIIPAWAHTQPYQGLFYQYITQQVHPAPLDSPTNQYIRLFLSDSTHPLYFYMDFFPSIQSR